MDGTPFGRYRLVELLGRGGMGEVWRAYDTQTDRVVALKVLPAHFASDEVFHLRFRREAHAAAQLREPHVVPIHDYGEIDGLLFLDMRLIDGHDLHSIIAQGPIAPARAVMIIEQVGAALNAAHKAGLVHRDVKPSNILVADLDFAYLIDFGIARAADHTNLTETGSMIGTWPYMAPERFSTGRGSPKSDTYALGCVLYECLTGQQPYPGNTVEQQVVGHLTMPPPRPSAVGHVPAKFDEIIATAMAKDPGARYESSYDLALAARAAITSPSPKPPMPPQAPADVLTITAARPPQPQPQHYVTPSPQRLPQGQAFRPPSHGTGLQGTFEPGPPTSDGKSRRSILRVLIPALLAIVLVAVSVVIFNQLRGNDAPDPKPVASPAPSPEQDVATRKLPQPNFQGTFSASLGPATYLGGAAVAGSGPLSQTWSMEPACIESGCVATSLVANGQANFSDMVFDLVDGHWVGVAVGPGANCHNETDQRWTIVTLTPASDSSLKGEMREEFPGGACATSRALTFARTGESQSGVADPEKVSPREVSPAAALRGAYTYTEVFPDHQHHHELTGETYCLRDGKSCLSYLFNAEEAEGYPMTFADGKWTANTSDEGACGNGEEQIATIAEYPLPQPAQNPITLLPGTAHRSTTGSCTTKYDFSVRLESGGAVQPEEQPHHH